MKASLKFREEKNPLLRVKLPFKVGALPLSSGVAIGNRQELAVHIGTFFTSGPAVKLSLKPNEATPVSVVFKVGLGAWGSPHGAPVTLKAEVCVSPKNGDPLFAFRLKPRVGDFSLHKDIDDLTLSRTPQSVLDKAVGPLQSNTPAESPPSVFTPPPVSGDGKAFPRRISGNFTDKDRARSPSLDSVVIGSNFSLKIEGLDREWKSKSDKKQKAEGTQDAECDVAPNGNGTLSHVQTDFANGLEKIAFNRRSWFTFSLAEVGNHLRGCKFVAHSRLPLGKQTKLNIKWGIKSPPDIFQQWDGSLPSLSCCKLPSLLLDKIALEQAIPLAEKPKALDLRSGYFDGGILPASFVEENRELAQVASLCFNMKRQLQLLYAENQVLRKSMEDMKSQVEVRGFLNPSKAADEGTSRKEQAFIGPPSHLEGPWAKDLMRKDGNVDSKEVSVLGASSDMSKELEKAIMSVKQGSPGSKG